MIEQDHVADENCFATSEELFLELGASKDQAKASAIKLERLAGNDLQEVPCPENSVSKLPDR